MDVRSMTVAGVAISGTEDEDTAEYFDHHEDAGELLDPLVDNAEAEEATKAKLKELDRLAEIGVHETVDLHVALGKKRVTTADHRKDGIRARFVAREFKGGETVYDVFAPCGAGCFHCGTPSLDLVQNNFSQDIHFKIVPTPKNLRVVLRSMELTNCKPTPTRSEAGSVKQKADDDADLDMQECSLHRGIVGSLQYLSIDRCGVQFETNACACAKEIKQPTKASWTRLKRLARYLARTQTAWHRLRPTGILASLVGQRAVGVSRTGQVNTRVATLSATLQHRIRAVLLFIGLEVRTELLLDSAAVRGTDSDKEGGTRANMVMQTMDVPPVQTTCLDEHHAGSDLQRSTPRNLASGHTAGSIGLLPFRLPLSKELFAVWSLNRSSGPPQISLRRLSSPSSRICSAFYSWSDGSCHYQSLKRCVRVAMARVCREAGAHARFNAPLRDMNVGVRAEDERRIKKRTDKRR